MAIALPALAKLYLPLLVSTQAATWSNAPIPSFLAAQIEQESCISLSSPKCWNPKVELKTAREYGFGFGQITKAFNANGSVRFDKFSELKDAHDSLKGWTWDTRFDARYQMIALVEMDKAIYNRIAGAASAIDRLAFTLSGYNGGESGVKQDRLMCHNTPSCDNSKWFGHVERTSTKSKVKWQGYGESAYAINRGYVQNVINIRRGKYESFFK